MTTIRLGNQIFELRKNRYGEVVVVPCFEDLSEFFNKHPAPRPSQISDPSLYKSPNVKVERYNLLHHLFDILPPTEHHAKARLSDNLAPRGAYYRQAVEHFAPLPWTRFDLAEPAVVPDLLWLIWRADGFPVTDEMVSRMRGLANDGLRIGVKREDPPNLSLYRKTSHWTIDLREMVKGTLPVPLPLVLSMCRLRGYSRKEFLKLLQWEVTVNDLECI